MLREYISSLFRSYGMKADSSSARLRAGGEQRNTARLAMFFKHPGSQCLAEIQVFSIFPLPLAIHIGFAVKEVCSLAAAGKPSSQHRH